MPKIKNKVVRYQVSLSGPQKDMMDKIMKEDTLTNVSGFFGGLLVAEFTRRKNRLNPDFNWYGSTGPSPSIHKNEDSI